MDSVGLALCKGLVDFGIIVEFHIRQGEVFLTSQARGVRLKGGGEFS